MPVGVEGKKDGLPWLVRDDHTALCLVKGPDDKMVKSVADCLCWVTSQMGLTDVKMIDHGLAARTQARLVT